MDSEKMAQNSKQVPGVASWELVCSALYSVHERRAMLRYPPLTKRSIDEVFLFRALTGKLFKSTYEYDDLRKRLLRAGFSPNLVALKTLSWTDAGIIEAHRRAKRAFQHNSYDDEDDENASHTYCYKKVNVSFVDLIKIADRSGVERFVPCAKPQEHKAVYFSTGYLPHAVSAQGTDVPTDFFRHVHVDITIPVIKKIEESWEFVCGTLYNAKKRTAMLGYPPLTKRSIDEVFLFRALTGKLFKSTCDNNDLTRRLLSSGFSMKLDSLKTLPWTNAGIVEAQCRAKQAFQHQSYDDEDDQNTNRNHCYKRINVSFLDLMEITDKSIVERFLPEARLRVHSTVYYSTGDVAQAITPQLADAPIDFAQSDNVIEAVPVICGSADSPNVEPTFQEHHAVNCDKVVETLSIDATPRNDAPTTLTHPVGVDETASTNENLNDSRLVPIKKKAKPWPRLGQFLPWDTYVAIRAKDMVKISHLWHTKNWKVRSVMITLVLAVAIAFHLLLWNLLGTYHGIKGERFNPRLRGGFSKENTDQPSVHPIGMDQDSHSDPNGGSRRSEPPAIDTHFITSGGIKHHIWNHST